MRTRRCLAGTRPILLLLILFLPLMAAAAPPAEGAGNEVQVQTALDGTGSTYRETNLGNLIADAVRQAGQAPIALVAANEIDENARIPTGRVPAERIVRALRSPGDAADTVVVLSLTGAQLLQAAERAVSRAPQPFAGFLQVSGLQIRYTPSPGGKDVSLTASDGSKIVPSQTYRVAMTHSIAYGGLGYFRIWSKKDITQDTSQSLAACLASYLAAHKIINSAVENRIVALARK